MFSLQYTNGNLRLGNMGRSALCINLFNVATLGPQSDTFEDHLTDNSIEPEWDSYYYTVGPSFGLGAGFGFSAHVEMSFDLIGFYNHVYGFIKDRW